jgi:hypothetical protein
MTAPTLDLTNIPEEAHAIAEKVNAQLSTALDFFRAPDDAPTAPDAGTVVPFPAPAAPEPPEEPAPAELPPAAETTELPPPTTPPVPVVTPEELDRLRALEAWAQGLDAQTQMQMAGIAGGQAVAVPTDEFARYRAWVAGQQSPPTSDPSRTPDLSDLDPEQAQYIQSLQAQNAALAAERERLDRERTQLLVPDQLAAQQQSERVIAETLADYGRMNGLDESTVGLLLDEAVQLNAFSMFVGANREINPVTGQVLREAPLDLVTRQALDFARVRHPELLTAPVSNPSVPAPDPTVPTITSVADDAVARKKANAASLAAAPSAATAPPAIDPRTLNPEGQRSLIADMIRQQTGAK